MVADDGRPGSEWWYWIAVTPFFGGLVALALAGLAVTLAVRPGARLAFFVPALVAVALLGVAFGVAFPVALFRDARAVRESAVEWSPDGRRYAGVGVVAVVATAFLGTIPVGVYYLYKRRQHVGTP